MSTTSFRYGGFSSPNGTVVPDDVFDILAPELSEAELRVLLYIVRRTFGFKKNSDSISLSQMVDGIKTKSGKVLDRGTGMSRRGVMKGCAGLVDKGIITVTKRLAERGDNEINIYSLRFKSDENSGEGVGNNVPYRRERSNPPVGNQMPPQETERQQTDEQELSNRFDIHSRQKEKAGSTLAPGKGAGAMQSDTLHNSLTPTPAANGAARPRKPAITKPDQPVDEDRELFTDLLQPYRQTFTDRASAKATVSRVLNLYRKSRMERSRFLGLLYEAASVTKESQQLGTIEGHAFAYFLKVMEGLVFPEEFVAAPVISHSPENGPGRTSETQQVLASSLPLPQQEEATAGQIVASAESSETAAPMPEEPDPIWHAVKEELQTMFTSSNFFTWIAPTQVIEHSGNRMTVGVAKPFHKHWIDTKLRPRIQQCLKKLGFGDVAVEFVVVPSG